MTATQVTRTKQGVFLNMEIERMETANFAAEKQAARENGRAAELKARIAELVSSGYWRVEMDARNMTATLIGASDMVLTTATASVGADCFLISADNESGADMAAGFELYLQERVNANRAAKGAN